MLKTAETIRAMVVGDYDLQGGGEVYNRADDGAKENQRTREQVKIQ